MPEYLSPGVYIEEISGVRPIEGVGTSTAGFVGQTDRGPTAPRLVTSWIDFTRWYGPWVDPTAVSFLPSAIRGFFDNGGQRAYVARVTRSNARSSFNIATAGDPLRVRAIGPGESGNRLFLRLRPGSQSTQARPTFRLTIVYYETLPPLPLVDPLDPSTIANPLRRTPDAVEEYDNLRTDPLGANYVLSTVNAASRLVELDWIGARGDPNVPLEFAAGQLAGGDDAGNVSSVMYLGGDPPDPDPARRTGLAALELIDDIAILCVPDHVHGSIPGPDRDTIRNEVLNQCERLKDRFAVLSADEGSTNVNGLNPPRDTSYGAFYYPWVRIYDTRQAMNVQIPPSGHVVGVYARTDIERGVHKAPANEVLRGIVTIGTGREGPLEFPVTKGMQDVLNPRGVNCLRDFRADRRDIRVWGARTMSTDGEWKYVNVRRLFIYIEESIDEGTQWVVFEPNDEPTWAKVRRSISNFLTRVWKSGALMGATAEEAFFVKCDRTTMTQDDIDNGRLICYIGIAPVKPAEFVIFRISQKTAEAVA
jgi:phage tail sheath protein FI